jgi:hypothetical protein
MVKPMKEKKKFRTLNDLFKKTPLCNISGKSKVVIFSDIHLGEESPKQLGKSDYWRVPLKKESLDYVFTRIKLLS